MLPQFNINNWKLYCPICGQIVLFFDQICGPCCDRLEQEIAPQTRKQNALEHRFLWNWQSRNGPLIAPYIHALKGSNHRAVFDFWSHKFIIRHHLLAAESKEILFVPVPSQRRINHANSFASSLAGLLGSKTTDALKVTEAGEQKFKSRQERQRIRFAVNENISLYDLKKKRVIIVDDILTTGATAQAAYIALGSPEGSEVWTLGYRSPQTKDK